MKPLESILVATDLSEHARHAAARAAALARDLGVRRGALLHVIPEFRLDPEMEARAGAAIAAQLQQEAEPPFEPRVASGRAVEEIARAAADFDLVVAGARGLHPLRDFAIGTTAERLLRKSDRPVLIVKRAPEGPYRRALVPVDFSADSATALAAARQVAPGAELTLAHAFEVAVEGKLRFAGVADERIHAYRREAREKAQAEMEKMIRGLGPGVSVTRAIAHGYPPAVIADAELQADADLVVIGKHGRSRLEELLLGSVTLHVLSAARCDVLVVHGAARQAGTR